MGLKQIDHGSREYAQMVNLRELILRKPLGLTFTREELEKEKNDILIGSFDEDVMLGCCILTKHDNRKLRLRQMAVNNNLQGKGVGASILSFTESLATDKGFSRIFMHARQTAIGFYEKFGYKIVGEQFLELNIPHFIMEKRIL